MKWKNGKLFLDDIVIATVQRRAYRGDMYFLSSYPFRITNFTLNDNGYPVLNLANAQVIAVDMLKQMVCEKIDGFNIIKKQLDKI